MKDENPVAWKCPLCGSTQAPIFIHRQEKKVKTKVQGETIVVDKDELAYVPPIVHVFLECAACGKEVIARWDVVYI